MAKVTKRPLKAMKRLSVAKVTKRQPKEMKRLSGAKVMKRTPMAKPKNRTSRAKVKKVFPWAKAMKRIEVEAGVFMVAYVARPCVTEQQMFDHYRKKIIPWLKYNKVTEVRCWIARYDGVLTLLLQVDEYVGEWNEIDGVQELYRSGPEGVLMEALLLSEDWIGKK